MKVLIQQADLERDSAVLIDTLRRYLTPYSNKSRFEWLYRQNPHGPTRAWLATDSETGETVGMSAAFSRRAIAKGNHKAGWVLGDFCIADKYRSLGPALQLQRATLADIADSGESAFCYDFPSRQLAGVYRRLGIMPAGHMVRLARPLRIESKLQQLRMPGSLAKPASWLGNLLLRASDHRVSNNGKWVVAVHNGECGDEFTTLRANLPVTDCIEIQRSAAYLTWRYLRHPVLHYQILTARKAGQLHGYLVFSCDDDTAHIAEWCPGDNADLFAALVSDLVRRLRKTKIMVLSAFLLDTDPRQRLLKSMGFWPRESSFLMAHWTGDVSASKPRWGLMYGDRDI